MEALADRVAVLKPQSAFFERFGSRGIAVLERAVADARDAGALVLMDAKRGDIGSTMAAYAAAFLDPASPLFSDARHRQPVPGLRLAAPGARRGAGERAPGVFVLALTSNPEGAEVQRATARGRPVGGATCSTTSRPRTPGRPPLGSVGAVVGATLGDAAACDLAVNGPLLAPGIGAQGATPGGPPGGLRRRGCAMSCRASAGGCCGTVRTRRRCGMRYGGIAEQVSAVVTAR